MKKTLLILFVIIFAMVAAISCSKGDTNPNESDDGGAKTENAEAGESGAPEEKSIFEILPKSDFKGEAFTVYVPPNPDSPVDKGTFVEELMGEIFNDAVYNRNLKIENEYNVQLNAVYGLNWDSTYGDLKKDVTSGDLRADVYFTHVTSGPAAIISDGLLREWSAVPFLDFERPWWNETAITNLNIANKMFYLSGSLSIQDPILLVFNKTLLQNLALEDPYKLVRQGTWTIEKLNKMAVDASKDLNGDGKFDHMDDQFGLEFGICWQTPSLLYACDELTIIIDGEGYPNVNMDNQKKIEAYEKIYELLWGGNKTYCFNGTTTQTANHPHMGIDSGRVLFCQYNLFTCENLRAAEVEYGILPLPKYDENQKSYMTNSWTGMYGLPVCVADEKLDMTGIVMESMSALGHKEVVPVYYDILLKEKVSRDDDSRDMLDIILSGIVFDSGLNYQAGSSQPGYFIKDLIVGKKQDYVSSLEKAKPKIEADYDKLYNKILEAGD
ncbi:MAG: hypothetical protein FWD23_06185 [Oscillospiraceae bacterium]|nr:hypothetical protein [Oscillospiraceae bacterium]